jgi:hypothetical protein
MNCNHWILKSFNLMISIDWVFSFWTHSTNLFLFRNWKKMGDGDRNISVLNVVDNVQSWWKCLQIFQTKLVGKLDTLIKQNFIYSTLQWVTINLLGSICQLPKILLSIKNNQCYKLLHIYSDTHKESISQQINRPNMVMLAGCDPLTA